MIVQITDKARNVTSIRPYLNRKLIAGNGCVWLEGQDPHGNIVNICLESLDIEQIVSSPHLPEQPHDAVPRL